MRAAVLEEFGKPLVVQDVDIQDPKAGEALVRICTNETKSTVDDAIGISTAYDPWVHDGDCDVLNDAKHRADFMKNCEFGSGFSKPYPTCGSILNTMSSDKLRHHLAHGFTKPNQAS